MFSKTSLPCSIPATHTNIVIPQWPRALLGEIWGETSLQFGEGKREKILGFAAWLQYLPITAALRDLKRKRREQWRREREWGGPPNSATFFSGHSICLSSLWMYGWGWRKQRGLGPILPVPFSLQRLPVLHCFLKSSATFSISGLKPHEYLIQFQMIWKTLNPSNTGWW